MQKLFVRAIPLLHSFYFRIDSKQLPTPVWTFKSSLGQKTIITNNIILVFLGGGGGGGGLFLEEGEIPGAPPPLCMKH